MLQRAQSYIILGAGISGLAVAYYLKKYATHPIDITLIEKSDCIGGKIQTDLVDGSLFERGPHSLRLAHPYRSLCESLFIDLGIDKDVIEADSSSNTRYLAYEEKLNPFPFHPLKCFSLKNLQGLILPFFFEKKESLKNIKDPSIYDFFSKRLSTQIADYLIDPMVAGIYGGDIKKLSFESCFPSIHELQKQKGSLLINMLKHKKKYPSKIITFKNGMKTLPEALLKKTHPTLFLDSTIEALSFDPKPSLILNHQKLPFDHLVSTIPSNELASLLNPLNLDLSQELNSIDYVHYRLVHLGFDMPLDLPKAFGFLAPSWTHELFSGAIFDSKIFPSQNSSKMQTRLSVLIPDSSPVYTTNQDLLVEEVLKQLKVYLKMNARPTYTKMYNIPKAVAQYKRGHQEKIRNIEKKIEEELPYLSLLGSSFYGVSVPACLANAERKAQKILKMKDYVTA